MPGATNYVGPLALPVAAGAQDSALDDPLLVGLLAYLGHWLSASLDAKFAALRGTNATDVGACPNANRFPWDPAKYFVRGDEKGNGETNYFPALYGWRFGRGQRVPYSTVKSLRRHTIAVQYIFDQLTLPGAWTRRSGLLNAVDAAFTTAAEWGYHPTFGLSGAPVGTPIAVALKLSGQGLVYDGGEQGTMAPTPGQTAARGAGQDGHVLRAYPTLKAQFTVWEMVEQANAVDSDDVAQGATLTLSGNTEGGVEDAVEITQRYLPAPDGSEIP